MRRAPLVLIALALLGHACGEPEPVAPAFPLRAVVAPALAEFGAESSAQGDLPVHAGRLPEDVLGMLDTLATPRSTMREVVLSDVRARGDVLVGALAAALEDEGLAAELRSAAVEALAAIDTPASVEPLVRALFASRTPWIRSQCAWRLGASAQDRFQPRLVLRLRYETDDETAVWLGSALARQGNFAGLDGLCVVRDRARTPETAALAADELARIAREHGAASGESLIAEWSNGDLERRVPRSAPSRALRYEAWKCIQGLAEWDLRVVDDRRFVLAHLNAWVVELLAAALHDENVYVRVHAAQCLERMGPRAAEAGSELLAALDEPRVAPAAASALGAVGHAPACERLERALAAADQELACAAARALGRLGEPRSAAALRRAFAAESGVDLRQAAAESLLALDLADVLPFLVERLTTPLAESSAAEQAIESWLARGALASPETFAERLAAWRALDTRPAGSIPTRAELDLRLAARAQLAAGWGS